MKLSISTLTNAVRRATQARSAPGEERTPHPSLYLLNHKRKFQVVVIPKIACTTLKSIAYLDDYASPAPAGQSIHDFFGYVDDGISMRGLDRPALPGFLRFSVFRDPVARAISLYREKFVAPDFRQPYYDRLGLIGCDFDTYLDFVSDQLGDPDPMCVEHHVRPQARFCDPLRHCDRMVHLKSLNAFLASEFQVEQIPRMNQTRRGASAFAPTLQQREKLRELYREDFIFAETHERLFWSD